MSESIYSDRYEATGTPYPDPDTMCQGQCEGMGCYPHRRPDWYYHAGEIGVFADQPETPAEREAWEHDHRELCVGWGRVRRVLRYLLRDPRYALERCDGWHFIACPDCNGTGKRQLPTPPNREKGA